ncbi:MAG: hypothetical protein K0S78_2476 [Thermomicrobiales bacterium]|nr:hypothetical protein [Thermomicrobiales bacterium]
MSGVGCAGILLGVAVATGSGGVSGVAPTATPTVGRACAPTIAATPEIIEMPTERDMELIEAARVGDTAAVERLLAEGASVFARDATGQTALIAAAWGNHLDAACALIEAGADVNVQDAAQESSLDSYNGTGLIRAAERGHFDVVARLLETDIPVDHVNRLGLTALLEAVMFGDGGPRYVETVRRLIEAGADVNLADGNGVTPLAHARQRGFTEVAVLLESAGGR